MPATDYGKCTYDGGGVVGNVTLAHSSFVLEEEEEATEEEEALDRIARAVQY
jgi:hypothetical protein